MLEADVVVSQSVSLLIPSCPDGMAGVGGWWQIEVPVTLTCSEDPALGYGLTKIVTTSWDFGTWVSCQLLGIAEPELLHL